MVQSLSLYLLVVVGGVLCFLSLAPVIGYIPYSDRPGPGWYGRPQVTWSEFWRHLLFLLSWATLLLPYAIAVGIVLYIVTRLLERIRIPRIAVAIVAALLTGFASGYIVAGIGWYIALGDPPVVFAMLLGAAFGGWLLPRKRASFEGAREGRSEITPVERPS